MELSAKPSVCVLLLFIVLRAAESNYSIDGGWALNADEKQQFTCLKEAKCEQLKNASCLDVILPYKYTAKVSRFGDLTFKTQADIHEYLAKWKILKSIPRCWMKLQSLLCTSLLPKCDENNDMVNVASQELCKLALGPCRVIESNFDHEIPPFFKCNNFSLFPPSCRNEYTDLKFNSSGVRCSLPLVGTDDSNIWYQDIEGCALQCYDPLYSHEDHRKIETFIFRGSILSFLCTLFCILTFLIDWKSSNRYPPVIIFYLNLCVMITNIGWLLQFFISGGKREIVCRLDNTLRYGSSSSEGYCPLIFFLIYYFSMAALVWFVNLAYAWDRFFRRVNSLREKEIKSAAYYHLSAWSIPVIFMLAIIILNEIDGNSLLGICFVGFRNGAMRFIFVLLPAILGLLIGSFFMIKCMITLIRAKLTTAMVTNSRVHTKIKCNILRIGLFIVFAIGALTCTFVYHIYYHLNYWTWNDSLHEQIICSLNITSALNPHLKPSECKMKSRPNLTFVYAQLIAIFGVGIATSSWVWTGATFATWRRCFRKKCPGNGEGPIRLKKHEVISKAWSKRDAISKGCYSPSFHSVHEDPVAMNLTSATSQDLSSTWATALPNFLSRRGGIAECANFNHYLNKYSLNNNHQSSISDISQQRFSFDSFVSRRDSQMSLEQDLAAIVKQRVRKTKKEREKLLRGHVRRNSCSARRGSDTSSQSLVSRPFIFKPQETVTKSTSTGDLQQGTSALHSLTIPKFPAIHMLPTQPILTSSIAHYANPSNSSYPVLTPTVTHVQHQRPPKPLVLNHPFTHGMSQQNDTLISPFEEKRRTDSGLFNNLSSLSSIQPNVGETMTSLPTNNNLGFGNFAFNNFQYPQPQVPYFPGVAPFFPTQNILGATQNSQYPNFVGNLPVFTSTPPAPQPPFNSYFSYPVLPVNHHANLEELQATIREREAYLHLIAPVDSSSEVGEFLPIQLSDSESFFTDGGGAAVSAAQEAKATQRLVDEHMQR
ncbi:smoothened-like protein, partial [Dinothrombium tinctorium]